MATATPTNRGSRKAANQNGSGALAREWFAVDKEGLAQLLAGRGPERAVLELIQNAWDSDATHCEIRLTHLDAGRALLSVEDDDPEGFADITHAFTLFAPSIKKGSAEKRGRFNLGEKLVLAICDEAMITTTKGRVHFDVNGRAFMPNIRREAGSIFEATIRLTEGQTQEALKAIRTLIPPPRCKTTVNGSPLPERAPVKAFRAKLATEVSGEDGVLRQHGRVTVVHLYPVMPGETAHVYEMGIPVMEFRCRWHADVGQRVPLTLERNALTERFTRQLRTAVIESAYGMMNQEDAKASWVSSALGDLSGEALAAVIKLRYGEKVVAADPTDPEAMKRAVGAGYTVVHGASLPAAAWATAREYELLPRAGAVMPSPRVIENQGGTAGLDSSKWTSGMRVIAIYANELAKQLLGREIKVGFYNSGTEWWAASYRPGVLSFNYGRLGHAWFNSPGQDRVDRVLLHEFGHEFESDHLSEQYHEALCKLGSRMRNVSVTIEWITCGDHDLASEQIAQSISTLEMPSTPQRRM